MARSEMLHAYDSAKSKGFKRSVRTDHGRVAEAEFRKWLTSFLTEATERPCTIFVSITNGDGSAAVLKKEDGKMSLGKCGELQDTWYVS